MPFTYDCGRCGAVVERHARAKLSRVYCSRSCCYADKATVPLRPCRHCGQQFKPAGDSGRPFCSRPCYEASRSSTVTKTCPVCSSEFTINAGQADRYTVCSRSCRTASTRYVDCGRCGTRFRSEKHLNRRYCSEACRRPAVLANCLSCGLEFRKLPSESARRFCSFACYRRYQGETTLEARVREALGGLGLEFSQEHRVGRWSVDFALLEERIALEADGTYWHAATTARDRRRDAALERAGWRVIRLAEPDIDAAADLGALILERLHDAPTSTGSSAQRQRG